MGKEGMRELKGDQRIENEEEDDDDEEKKNGRIL